MEKNQGPGRTKFGWIRSQWKNILLALSSVILTLIVLEAAANIWLLHFASPSHLSSFGTFEQIARSQELLFERHHYLQYTLKPNYEQKNNKHNSLGYRGDEIEVPKPPGTYRIVAMGGSTTYTSSVEDYRKSYPFLLQELLRQKGHKSVEVVNAGVPAYSSWETLINLEFRIIDLEPDLIIIYHGINDVHPRLVYPFDAYKGDNSGSRVPYSHPEETLWDRSTFLRIIRTGLGIRKPLGGLGFRRTFEYVPTNYAEQFYQQSRRGTYPSGEFQEHSVAEMLEQNPPVYFERNLRNMIAIAEEQGIEVLLVTFAWSPLFKDEARAASPEYSGALKEQNQVLLQLCETHQVYCYDFAAEMPVDREFWADGRHVNELGARRKAELFADYINDTIPID